MDPLTAKEVLQILEHLYDLVLDIEQLRREQSSLDVDDIESVGIWCVYSNNTLKLSSFTNALQGTHSTLNLSSSSGMV